VGDEDRHAPRTSPGLYIDEAVPDHERICKVKIEVLGGPEEQARLRFPAVADDPVPLDKGLRVVQAVVFPVEIDPAVGQSLSKLGVHPVKLSEAELPLGHSGLV